MSQAIFDPEAARYFAGGLEKLGSDLQGKNQALIAKSQLLGDEWRDAKYRAFQSDFDETTMNLAQFLEDCEKYVAYLREKARIIEEEFHR